MLERAQRIGRRCCTRPVGRKASGVLSENDLEHLTLAWARCGWASPRAGLLGVFAVPGDFAKRRFIRAALTPGMVFASNPAYAR
jgi:feruloyl-CoA synthase